MRTITIFGVLAILAAGCSCGTTRPADGDAGVEDDAGEPLPEECEGLDPSSCLLPWPSSRFLVEDETMPTGLRVVIDAAALSRGTRSVLTDPAPWNGWDGFSPSTSMVVRVPGTVGTAFARWVDEEAGTRPDSPTIVLNAETGERIAHFVDVRPDTGAGSTSLLLRPLRLLPESTHVVVAIRALTDGSGAPIEPFPAFAALRDGSPAPPAIERRRAAFEADVFGPLGGAGIAREDLWLAWDFHTSTGEPARRDLVAMAASALAMTDDLACTVTEVLESSDDPFGIEQPHAQIRGTFEVPMFLESEDEGARLRRADGVPIAGPTRTVAKFLAVVPPSVRGSSEPAPLVVHGHGLRTARWEVREPWSVQMLEEARMIGVATDIVGLRSNEDGDDGERIAQLLRDPDRFGELVDQVLQSLVAMVVLPRVLRACAGHPGARLAIGPEVHYVGHSLGGGIGPTIAAVHPDIVRYGLGVGGIEYPVMIPRSFDVETLLLPLPVRIRDRVEEDLVMAMFANHWDRFEGAGFAAHVDGDLLSEPRARAQILLQVGQHDTSTPDVGSDIAARSLGLDVLASSVRRPWGIGVATEPSDRAYVVYDEAEPVAPPVDFAPGAANCVHQRVRRDPRARSQLVELLRTGAVTSSCPEVPCAPPSTPYECPAP